jgi:nickel superoxide dismutase
MRLQVSGIRARFRARTRTRKGRVEGLGTPLRTKAMQTGRRLVMHVDNAKLMIGMTVALAGVMLTTVPAFSHCEIPCGIYGDPMRIAMMQEDIATIEKSMKLITELSKQTKPNYNQIVRWVENKEHHADKIREVVTQYFMTQRVKPVDPKDSAAHDAYVKKLTLLHEMMFYAMKCKQTTDLAHVEKLKKLVDAFSKAYFSK